MFANFPAFLLVIGGTNKKTGKLTKNGISYIQILDMVFMYFWHLDNCEILTRANHSTNTSISSQGGL